MERLGKKKSGRGDKKEGGRFGLCPNSVSVIVTGKGAGTRYKLSYTAYLGSGPWTEAGCYLLCLAYTIYYFQEIILFCTYFFT